MLPLNISMTRHRSLAYFANQNLEHILLLQPCQNFISLSVTDILNFPFAFVIFLCKASENSLKHPQRLTFSSALDGFSIYWHIFRDKLIRDLFI